MGGQSVVGVPGSDPPASFNLKFMCIHPFHGKQTGAALALCRPRLKHGKENQHEEHRMQHIQSPDLQQDGEHGIRLSWGRRFLKRQFSV